ncbi:MAG: YjcZ family sporulation protein [Anaerobacillus sp.]
MAGCFPPATGAGATGFALILVLFILLVIIGTAYVY